MYDVASRALTTLRPFDETDTVLALLGANAAPEAARELVRECLRTGEGVEETIQSLGLDEVIDDSQLEAWCEEALEANPRVRDEVLAGNAKALGACIGPVMKASAGKADPKRITEVLKGLIEGSS